MRGCAYKYACAKYYLFKCGHQGCSLSLYLHHGPTESDNLMFLVSTPLFRPYIRNHNQAPLMFIQYYQFTRMQR